MFYLPCCVDIQTVPGTICCASGEMCDTVRGRCYDPVSSVYARHIPHLRLLVIDRQLFIIRVSPGNVLFTFPRSRMLMLSQSASLAAASPTPPVRF